MDSSHKRSFISKQSLLKGEYSLFETQKKFNVSITLDSHVSMHIHEKYKKYKAFCFKNLRNFLDVNERLPTIPDKLYDKEEKGERSLFER